MPFPAVLEQNVKYVNYKKKKREMSQPDYHDIKRSVIPYFIKKIP
jgi:hypothetical protein